MTIGRSSDFSRIADRYDDTRNLPSEILGSAFHQLYGRGVFSNHMRILDAGCGTGQISIPLVNDGHRITGIDLSEDMLEIARSKTKDKTNVDYIACDVQSLPFRDATFDGVVVSKLFQHVGNWRRAVDELTRVTRSRGYILHIQDRGAFNTSVRREFSRLADMAEYKDRYIGTQRLAEVKEYFQSKGIIGREERLNSVSWEKHITYQTAFSEIKDRMFAEFWSIPDQKYQILLDELEKWISQHPGGMNTCETLKCQLVIDSYCV